LRIERHEVRHVVAWVTRKLVKVLPGLANIPGRAASGRDRYLASAGAPLRHAALATCMVVSACAAPPAPVAPVYTGQPQTLVQPASPLDNQPATRVSGRLDAGLAALRPSASYSAAPALSLPAQNTGQTQGDISLDFAGTDIRTVVDQILGSILQQNYTIDPGVTGTVTLRTTAPLSRDQLVPTLQTLLAQCSAVLVRSNGMYRVMPADAAAATANFTTDDALGGAVLVPLHYVQAAPLAQTLQPFGTPGTRIIAATDENALIVEGDPANRTALVNLIQAFDVDQLSGQSYELFPVTSGDAKDFGAAFAGALNKSTDPSVQGPVTVVPLERINAVLVIAKSQSLIFDAQRVYAVLSQVDRETLRSWHVYYLHNGRSNDAAYVLQQAFTPDNVTAQPTPPATGQISTVLSSQSGVGGSGGAGGGGTGATGISSTTGGATAAPASTDQSSSSTSGAAALLGPLSAGANGADTDQIRIIPDNANNSLLIYATEAEDERISAMLDKIDISPVEVRIDATIAEVDLTGALQYGTQFFFKSGGINAVLTEGTSAALATNFPGFVLSGHGGDAAPLAITLLQSVTKVNVLSSPELMVLDGQAASLQVGNLVPYLSQTSQSTLTSGAPVVNSIEYRETGVILQVTPHVGSDGLVTLDVAQEVSAVQNAVTTAGINSPTFSDRAVTSRVAIQDGQTVGLAGLISDSDSHQNQGIPYLKNVPLLGDLFSTQNNQRSRTELLVLITPHVIRTTTDAAAFTADLRAALPDASGVPAALVTQPAASTADPDARLRSQIPP
jgi:general secretion pathway protein D